MYQIPKARADDLMEAFADPVILLPYGAKACIDPIKKTFCTEESAVVDE